MQQHNTFVLETGTVSASRVGALGGGQAAKRPKAPGGAHFESVGLTQEIS
jgi:hypothetical protein